MLSCGRVFLEPRLWRPQSRKISSLVAYQFPIEIPTKVLEEKLMSMLTMVPKVARMIEMVNSYFCALGADSFRSTILDATAV